MKHTIRRQLMATLLGSIGTLMLLGVGVLYLLVGRALLTQFDDGLQTKVGLLTMFPEVNQDGIDLEFTERRMPEFERADSGEYYQLWLHDGSVLSKSRSLGDASLPPQCGTMDKPVFWNFDLPNGRPGRAVGVGFLPTSEDGYLATAGGQERRFSMVLVFARDRTSLDRILAEVRVAMLAMGGMLLVLTGLLVNRALNKGLDPLKWLTREVEALEAGSLTSARVASEGLPGELIPIATELNLLINRLNEAFQRERRLTADVAHELNTPLSELLTASEVALKWPDDPEATQNLAQQTVDTVRDLQKVSHALLELARQQTASETDLQAVNLPGLWREVRKLYASAARKQNLRFDEDIPADAMATTNRVLLKTILRNLLENAIAYSPEGATIVCKLTTLPAESWQVRLENPNTDLNQADLEHLFDPLWRHDTSRTGSKHSGIGLALVKTVADRLGIDVHACLPTPDTFCMVVEQGDLIRDPIIAGKPKGEGE